MENKTLFPHKTFLEQNGIDIDKLPAELKKRILGFEDLENDLANTVDEDKEKLLDRLENLSHELDEDLEEHFDEDIENNDEQEDDEKEIEPHSPIQPEEKHECNCKHAKGPEVKIPEQIPVVKVLSDEEILDELLKQGRTKILPEDLRKKGFRGELKFRVVVVGSIYLRRGKYSTTYEILRGW